MSAQATNESAMSGHAMSGRIARSLSAEWRKMRATKLWWVLAIVIAGYSAMVAAMFAFMIGSLGDAAAGGLADATGTGSATPAGTAPMLDAQDGANLVYSSVSTLCYAVPLLLGAIAATGELRHGTLALTFTFEPRRGIVLLAKTVVLLAFGVVLGAAGLVGAVGTGASILSVTGGDPMLTTAATWALLARVVAALGIWAVIGFGVGLLVRNQAFAIVIALVFTQFVEPMLRLWAQFWEWSAQVAKFLPGAATDDFVGAGAMNDLSMLDASAPAGSQAFGIGAGFAVLAAYALIAVLAGWALRWRGDVH